VRPCGEVAAARRLQPLLESAAKEVGGRGLHSFSLSNSRTNSRVKLGYTADGTAQVELKWERA
jgi:hypothetical protein